MKIKFICEDPIASSHWKPIPAKDCLPKWYSNMPPAKTCYNFEESATKSIKGCVPVSDYLTSGYIIPNIYEVTIEDKFINFKKDMTISTAKHANTYDVPDQGLVLPREINVYMAEECPVESHNKKIKRNYFRFDTEWAIQTPPGYSCLIFQPYYFFEEKYHILPAIVDTDEFNKRIPVVGYCGTDEFLRISPGTPLLQVVPFKRDEWEMEVVNEKILDKGKFYLYNVYKNLFHREKKFK